MTTLYDLFPKKDGMYADELTYNVSTGSYYLLYFNPDGNDGDGEFVDLYIDRRDIREAKQAYDRETDDVEKMIAFISSICENCSTWVSDWDCDDDDFGQHVNTYIHNVYTAVSNVNSECVIFFGLSTDREHLALDEADRFISMLLRSIEEDKE